MSVHMALFPELTGGIPEEHRQRAANWTRLIEVRRSRLWKLTCTSTTAFPTLCAPCADAVNEMLNG